MALSITKIFKLILKIFEHILFFRIYINEVIKRDMKSEEITLIEKAKNGDESAFKTLLEPYVSKLLNIGYYILKNREDAWDILQETLILLWKNIKKLDSDYPFYPYVKKIYTNQCLKHIRKFKDKGTLSIDYEYEENGNLQLEDYSFDPEGLAQNEEFKNKVKKAMDELPTHYRTTIWLRVGEGMSYKEISELLGINIGTVKSRINTARRLIVEKLGDYLGGETSETS